MNPVRGDIHQKVNSALFFSVRPDLDGTQKGVSQQVRSKLRFAIGGQLRVIKLETLIPILLDF